MSNLRIIPYTEIVELVGDRSRANADTKQRIRGVVNEVYTLDIPKNMIGLFLKRVLP